MSLKIRDSTSTVTAADFDNTITIPMTEIETVQHPLIERVARLADDHPKASGSIRGLRSDAVNMKLVGENRHGVDILLSADACGRLRLR
jgi:hypothetical protein